MNALRFDSLLVAPVREIMYISTRNLAPSSSKAHDFRTDLFERATPGGLANVEVSENTAFACAALLSLSCSSTVLLYVGNTRIAPASPEVSVNLLLLHLLVIALCRSW